MALDKIRSLVIIALGDGHYTQAGILEVQLQQMELGCSDRFNEKPLRTVVIDGITFVTPAECVRYHEGKKFKQASAPIAEADFITCSWRRAILQLPEHEQNWINYVYGSALNYECQTAICFYIWENFLTQHKAAGFKAMKQKTIDTMRRLTFYCIQQVRLDLLGIKKPGAEDADKKEFAEDKEMSLRLGMSIESWRKDYKKRWQIMKKVCLNLDELSLLLTAEIRHETISCNRSRGSDMPVPASDAQEARKTCTQILRCAE